MPEEELDVLPECTNLNTPSIHELPIEDDYHSGNSSSSEGEFNEEGEPDTDMDEEEGVEPPRYQEYKSDHRKYDDMYADVESDEVTEWTCDTEEVEVGTQWPTMAEYKLFVTKFCIANCIEVEKFKDDPTRLRCRCKVKKCPFRLFANRQPGGHTVKITKYIPKHICVNRTGTSRNRMANSSWVASVIVQDINEDDYSLQPKKIQSRPRTRFGVELSYWVAWKGKALTKKFGSYEDGYKFAPEVMDQILKNNEGSIKIVTTDTDKDFSFCCLAFDAFLTGFKDGCRPFIGLDGCFLKGKYGGVMLSAVELDSNNGMYSLAIFICDCENKENWILFLNIIKDRFLEHPAPLTFISDRQKGFVSALQEVFSSNRNRFCFRHIFENFKGKVHKGTHMKTLAWGEAKAYRNTYHNRYMSTMEIDNKRAHQWFEDIPTHLWARSTFDTTLKCEHVTNNIYGSLNSWTLDVRSKPLHRILEGFNLKMMGLMFDRKMKVKEWEAEGLVLFPRADRIIKHRVEKKRRYNLFGSSEFCWCVQNHETSSRWNVDVKEKTCNCNVWELTGIPCVHAIVVACHLRLDINSLVHDYHTVSFYKKDYAGKVVACDNQDHWNEEES
ncbi:uncharacterized protein LOC113324307 [Papaver somniferum]|uniref:uncharacterized protein LOC113324307 n=1 Tax=Papaver somniferum TaxID=3469 RepID=UPI000E701CB8|nr:uncharacterized protein LOC113324307 [Papaver somniferum]